MEKSAPFFPQHGKLFGDFSTPWKKFPAFFHAMEKSFPHRGKSGLIGTGAMGWARDTRILSCQRLGTEKGSVFSLNPDL
ncbi:MAG: hypothetical protein GX548_02825 [Lentisphaerae bacterium]|nr:hypothetical protein [Lentisphaerota bacterium]